MNRKKYIVPCILGIWISLFTIGCFQDKYDRLLQLKDRKKIVLFSGSSTRFGYDSAMIDDAFEEYDVVNMGVFAYTSALPQLQLILECMQEGDILLHAPEFDTSSRQFCGGYLCG